MSDLVDEFRRLSIRSSEKAIRLVNQGNQDGIYTFLSDTTPIYFVQVDNSKKIVATNLPPFTLTEEAPLDRWEEIKVKEKIGKVKTADYCGKGRVPQISGTCWLNAPLNCILLATALQPFINRSYQTHRITQSSRQALLVSCPTLANLEDYVHAIVMKNKYFQRKQTDILGSLGTKIKKDSTVRGYYPEKGLEKLMEVIFLPGMYTIIEESDHFPSGVPIVVVTSFEGIQKVEKLRQLEAAIFTVRTTQGLGGHAISYFRCEGKGYLYDSEEDQIKPFNLTAKWQKNLAQLYPGEVQMKAAIYCM